MNAFLIQIISITGQGVGGDSIFAEILVILVLVSGWGLYNLVKKKPQDLSDEEDNYVVQKRRVPTKQNSQPRPKIVVDKIALRSRQVSFGVSGSSSKPRPGFEGAESSAEKEAPKLSRKDKEHDLNSGMELLDMSFLLGVVENDSKNDPKEITMCKLCFNEILRRGKQSQIHSNGLKFYAVNKGNYYSKDIQREALKELSVRTAKKATTIKSSQVFEVVALHE